MSGEAFTTVLTCDMRMNFSGEQPVVEYAPSHSGEPRWLEIDPLTGQRVSNGWACGHLYAEGAVRISADTIRAEVLEGLSGDMPDKRALAADLLDAVADLVKLLAYDAAHDGTLRDEAWAEALSKVASLSTVGAATA